MRPLLAIGTLLAISSSALAEIPASKVQNECAMKAHNAYLAKLQPRMMSQDSTIDDVVAERRLMEGYCAQFVHCLEYSVSVQGAKFQTCLDDEDADRLHDAWE